MSATRAAAGTSSRKLGGFAMITILIVITVLVLRLCIAAALSVCLRRRDEVMGRMANSNLQVLTLSVPAQDCITMDDMPVSVGAVRYVRVVDAGREKLRPELTDASSEQSWRQSAPLTAPAPVGPQDAPAGGPWDTARGPQDAIGAPQDAARADMTIVSVEAPVDSLGTLIQANLQLLAVKVRDAFGLGNPSSESPSGTSSTRKRVVPGWAFTIEGVQSRGATRALRDFAAHRGMPLVTRSRDAASGVPGGDLTHQRAAAAKWTILETLPRPVGGPAYFGGREDSAYLRGWDDGVDGVRQGHQATGPNWGSAAYMTGWRNAVRASEKALRGLAYPLSSQCP